MKAWSVRATILFADDAVVVVSEVLQHQEGEDRSGPSWRDVFREQFNAVQRLRSSMAHATHPYPEITWEANGAGERPGGQRTRTSTWVSLEQRDVERGAYTHGDFTFLGIQLQARPSISTRSGRQDS